MVQLFRFRRARAQGMTEYIIIVGLIAVLLVGVVRRFSSVLDVTIQGSTGTMETTVGGPIDNAAAASEDEGPQVSGDEALWNTMTPVDGTDMRTDGTNNYKFENGHVVKQ